MEVRKEGRKDRKEESAGGRIGDGGAQEAGGRGGLKRAQNRRRRDAVGPVWERRRGSWDTPGWVGGLKGPARPKAGPQEVLPSTTELALSGDPGLPQALST